MAQWRGFCPCASAPMSRMPHINGRLRPPSSATVTGVNQSGRVPRAPPSSCCVGGVARGSLPRLGWGLFFLFFFFLCGSFCSCSWRGFVPAAFGFGSGWSSCRPSSRFLVSSPCAGLAGWSFVRPSLSRPLSAVRRCGLLSVVSLVPSLLPLPRLRCRCCPFGRRRRRGVRLRRLACGLAWRSCRALLRSGVLLVSVVLVPRPRAARWPPWCRSSLPFGVRLRFGLPSRAFLPCLRLPAVRRVGSPAVFARGLPLRFSCLRGAALPPSSNGTLFY